MVLVPLIDIQRQVSSILWLHSLQLFLTIFDVVYSFERLMKSTDLFIRKKCTYVHPHKILHPFKGLMDPMDPLVESLWGLRDLYVS